MERFNFNDPQIDPIELYGKMKEAIVTKRAVGVTASNVGYDVEAFAIGHPDDPDNIIPVFNPRLVDVSDDTQVEEEGDIENPGLFIKIERPLGIKVRYTTHTGVTDTIKLGGFTARAWLHEFDKLNGLPYTKKAKKIHLDQARRQKKKFDRIRKKRMMQNG